MGKFFRQRLENVIAIFEGVVSGGDGRLEVGHGDAAAELLGGVGEDGGGGWTVAEVVMEVIGKGYG